jgi:hypothetical protein
VIDRADGWLRASEMRPQLQVREVAEQRFT